MSITSFQNYPKLEKYISLYPPEVRQQESKGKYKESVDIEESTPETDRRRAELRKQINVGQNYPLAEYILAHVHEYLSLSPTDTIDGPIVPLPHAKCLDVLSFPS